MRPLLVDTTRSKNLTTTTTTRPTVEELHRTTNKSLGQIMAGILCAALISVPSPFPSRALAPFGEIDNPIPALSVPAMTAGSFGLPPPGSSTPYFSSAGATRLLVNPSSSSSSPRLSPEMQKQLVKQRALQDFRLEQCHESGLDWEQCFYYGTGSGPGNPAAPLTLPNMNDNNSLKMDASTIIKAKTSKANMKVPTW